MIQHNSGKQVKTIFIFCTLIFLFACTQPPEQKAGLLKSITPATLAKSTTTTLWLDKSITYNYTPDSKLTPWQGTFKEAVYWKDKRGENIFIISELPQYFWKEIKPGMRKYVEDKDDSEVAELFAYHYIYNQEIKKWKIYWALNDFRFSNCDVWMKYLPGTLKITDIDENDKGESIFAYYSASCTQTLDLNYHGKLILHIDSLKYSIKGVIGFNRHLEGIAKASEYSENFSQLNRQYKTYFQKMWERTIVIRDSTDLVIKKQWGS